MPIDDTLAEGLQAMAAWLDYLEMQAAHYRGQLERARRVQGKEQAVASAEASPAEATAWTSWEDAALPWDTWDGEGALDESEETAWEAWADWESADAFEDDGRTEEGLVPSGSDAPDAFEDDGRTPDGLVPPGSDAPDAFEDDGRTPDGLVPPGSDALDAFDGDDRTPDGLVPPGSDAPDAFEDDDRTPDGLVPHGSDALDAFEDDAPWLTGEQPSDAVPASDDQDDDDPWV